MKKPKMVLPLEKQIKLSESSLRDVEAMIMTRFSGVDWSERFKQFRDENELKNGS